MKTKPKTSIVYPDPLPEETLEELIARAKKAFRGGRDMPKCKKCEEWNGLYGDAVRRVRILTEENGRLKATVKDLTGKLATAKKGKEVNHV